jgi:uncharacterized membrane protein
MEDLIIAVLFLLVTILYYLMHKSWLEESRREGYSAPKQITKVNIWRDWLLLIGSAIISIFYFYKAIF